MRRKILAFVLSLSIFTALGQNTGVFLGGRRALIADMYHTMNQAFTVLEKVRANYLDLAIELSEVETKFFSQRKQFEMVMEQTFRNEKKKR